MRRFHSYGPVDAELHYCAPRPELVDCCVAQLVGSPDKGGHFFTIWAARQTGKTWLMRQAMAAIQRYYGDRFTVGTLSMQGVVIEGDQPAQSFFSQVPNLFANWFKLQVPAPASWGDFTRLFREGGPFPKERPLILLIDEFDRLPQEIIDPLVTQFRDLYLNPETSVLHGLALIGVRAALGVDSPRGSPFNVQRSLHVPNLTLDELRDMFGQYSDEHGRPVDAQVVTTLHEMTRGQPGLCGWFGELLTEKYTPKSGPITMATWDRAYLAACQVEPNNTMLNLLKKARSPYLAQVLEIFGKTDVPFSFGQEWCNYLYLNGVIDAQETVGASGDALYVCRFSSPFVQQRLFHDLGVELLGKMADMPLDPLDTLEDVFTEGGIVVPLLLQRYVAYLTRLRKAGKNPFVSQPLRADLNPTEAIGHFHLHHWLERAVVTGCVVTPEFPTGNGTVDLVLRWRGRLGIIEVKSFLNLSHLRRGQEQAAGYATRLGSTAATVAVFVPITETDVLHKLSTRREISGITVDTVAISSAP